MLKVFKEEPIVIKGAMNYSLKTIAKQMHYHKMIKTDWSSVSLTDGAAVILQAINAKKESDEKNISLKDTNNMKEIERYNEIDCKTIFEILTYLRKNNI